jgi:glycosyltransferase involved in cell wall biosynthesis
MISIAMTTYNGEKYIDEQINSILRQTYQDFELIICDDASNDSTWNILQKYERLDRRIHCFLNEKNLGFIKNFEKTITLCQYDYIALSDQDDIWTDDHLEKLLENIGENQLCAGDAELVDEDGQSLHYTTSDLIGGLSLLDTCKKKTIRNLYCRNRYQGASMMLRKDLIKNVLPIPNSMSYHDTWFSLCACVQNKFMYIDDVITKHRRHGFNASPNPIDFIPVNSVIEKNLAAEFIIKKILKKFEHSRILFDDRIYYCQNLIERFPSMEPEIKKVLVLTEEYYINHKSFLFRLKNFSFFIKNYNYIFDSDLNSSFRKIKRLVRFLFI